MPALCRAPIVILLAMVLGMPAAFAQGDRSGQWTDPPSRAGASAPDADKRGSGDQPAPSARTGGKADAREAGRAGPAPARARPAAASRAAERRFAIRKAMVRTAARHRMRAARAAALRPRLRSARIDRHRMVASRRIVRSEPARDPVRVGAIGQTPIVATPRPRRSSHAIVRGRPQDDPGPFDPFDPDMTRFDWCD